MTYGRTQRSLRPFQRQRVVLPARKIAGGQRMEAVCLGIDVGSTTIKVVALDKNRKLLGWRYVRSCGRPRVALLETLEDIGKNVDRSGVRMIGLSGSGGGPIADIIGGLHVNE